MQHKIVIKRHRPGLRAALIAGVTAVIAIGAFGLYTYTRQATVSEFEKARSELDRLRDERRDLVRQLRAARSEVDTLRERVVYAERSGEIDVQACATVRETLSGLQAEAADLREQVAFYRGIVSPDESKAGVRVLDLKLTPQDGGGRAWRYDLVLIQPVRHDKRVSGNVHLRVLGSQGGKQEVYEMEQLLTAQGATPPRFAFKYFQEFTGEFRLPDGFRPLRIAVTLMPESDGTPRVEDEYEWGRILSEKGNP